MTRNQIRAALAGYRTVTRLYLPPEEGGQIVQTEWGTDGEHIVARRVDRSSRMVAIYAYALPAKRDDGSFDPWNGTPETGAAIGVVYQGRLADEPTRGDD